jgi:hypothetical protein
MVLPDGYVPIAIPNHYKEPTSLHVHHYKHQPYDKQTNSNYDWLRLRYWINHYYRLRLRRSMDPNLSGSCSQRYHTRSDHGAVSGKGAESRQRRNNHHLDSGVLRTQHAIPQPPPEPCPTRQGRGLARCWARWLGWPCCSAWDCLHQLVRQSHLQHCRSNGEGSTSGRGHQLPRWTTSITKKVHVVLHLAASAVSLSVIE